MKLIKLSLILGIISSIVYFVINGEKRKELLAKIGL